MSMHRHSALIQSVASASASEVEGSAYQCRNRDGDGVPENLAGWGVLFQLTQTSTGTVDAKLQHSWDGSTWMDVSGGAMTQLTAAGARNEHKAISAVLGPYVRTVFTPGGSASLVGTARLTSDGGFTASVQS